jgi:hypothetical protein
MTAVPISTLIGKAITPNRYGRNQQIASVQAMNELIAGFNQVFCFRTRQLAVIGGRVESIGASVGVGPVTWGRAYSFTGANVRRLRYSITLAKPTMFAVATDPYADIVIANSGGVFINSSQAHYGAFNGSALDTPDEWKVLTGTIDSIPSSSALQITVNVYNNARVISVTIWEESAFPDTIYGYLLGVSNMSPIFADTRAAIATSLKSLVDDNGGTQIALNDILFTTSSATQKNIFDQTSTTVTVNTPGITLDMRYKGRRSKSDVPINVAVYVQAAAGTNGSLKIYNAAGAVVLSLGPWTGTSWVTGSFRAPLTQAKYDVMLSTAASNVSILHLAMWEQGT